jgi:hypothetical protein
MILRGKFKYKRHCSILCSNRLLFGTTLLLAILTGCTTFKRNDPSPVGMWYPNSPIKVELTKDNFFKSDEVLNLGSRPIEIKSVGQMTWNSLIGDYYETALLKIHFSNNTVGYYYARTSFLQKYGRIEYTGSKKSMYYFWDGVGRFFMSPLGIILVVIVLVFLTFFKLRNPISHKNTYDSHNSGSYSSDVYSPSSYSSEDISDSTFSNDEDRDIKNESTSSTNRCTDCQSIDLSGWGFTSKGNGRCKECNGTGHDRGTEALVQFGTLGLEDGKYDCKTCSGTGQCQTCGGTGVV